MYDSEQFYPTPKSLVQKAQGLFKKKHITNSSVLDPSSGTGSLVENFNRYNGNHIKSDACEINPDRLDYLSKCSDITVVGHDFLEFYPSKKYDCIIMNPPFNNGVKHLLHAWEIGYNTEIVCILNAQSIKNANSKDRQYLNGLIEQYGSVEFITEAFSNAERKTNVEIALIYLYKETPVKYDYLQGLDVDLYEPDFKGLNSDNQLAIPNNVIENSVLAYNQARAALEYMVESNAITTAKYAQLSKLLGGSLTESEEERKARISKQDEASRLAKPSAIANAYNAELAVLKRSAWNYVLSGIGFYDQLSVKAKKEFDSQFEKVSKLEFTEVNIHGFLQGVSLNKGAMIEDMMVDLFDRFTGTHLENRQYYKAWKSNEKHKSNAWRLKATRVVMPIIRWNSWGGGVDWDCKATLSDIDKAMAALDGKQVESVYGLAKAVEESCETGVRHNSDYFEFRLFMNGNIHLFPKRKDLIDRLNRTVGKLRTWLPEDDESVTNEFWKNYDSEITSKHVEKTKLKMYSWCKPNEDELEQAINESLIKQKIDCNKFIKQLS